MLWIVVNDRNVRDAPLSVRDPQVMKHSPIKWMVLGTLLWHSWWIGGVLVPILLHTTRYCYTEIAVEWCLHVYMM